MVFAGYLAFFNLDNDTHIHKSLVIIIGYVLFIINFDVMVKRYTYSIGFITVLISLYNEYIFYSISITGFLIFTYIIYKCKLYGIIVAVFLSLLIFPHTTNNFQSDPLFEHSLIDKTDRHDLFYHSTIASNYKINNFCTTALHGAPKFKYWDLTNILSSKLSIILNIRCIDIYNYILPILLWLILLRCFLDLALTLQNKLHPLMLLLHSSSSAPDSSSGSLRNNCDRVRQALALH